MFKEIGFEPYRGQSVKTQIFAYFHVHVFTVGQYTSILNKYKHL